MGYQRFGFQRRPYGGGRGGGGLCRFGHGLHGPNTSPWTRLTPFGRNGFSGNNVHFRQHSGRNNQDNNQPQGTIPNQNNNGVQPQQQSYVGNASNQKNIVNNVATNKRSNTSLRGGYRVPNQQQQNRSGNPNQGQMNAANGNQANQMFPRAQTQRNGIQPQQSANFMVRNPQGQNFNGGQRSQGGKAPRPPSPFGRFKKTFASRKLVSNVGPALEALRSALRRDKDNFKELNLQQAFDRLNSNVVPSAPPQNDSAAAGTSGNVSYLVLLQELQKEVKQDVSTHEKISSKNNFYADIDCSIGQTVASVAKWKDVTQNQEWRDQLYYSIMKLTKAICKVCQQMIHFLFQANFDNLFYSSPNHQQMENGIRWTKNANNINKLSPNCTTVVHNLFFCWVEQLTFGTTPRLHSSLRITNAVGKC